MALQQLRFAPLLLAAVASAAVAQDPPAAPKAHAGPNRLVAYRNGILVSLDPDGKNVAVALPFPAGSDMLMRSWPFVVSPDGRLVAGLMHRVERKTFKEFFRLAVHEIGNAKNAELDEIGNASAVAWSADGTQLAFCPHVEEEGWQHPKPVSFIYTLATKTRERVNLPPNHYLLDWSRDGRYFVTRADLTPPDGPWADEVWVMNRDGTPGKRLLGPGQFAGGYVRLSPDGKRALAHITRHPPDETPDEKAARKKRRLPPPLPWVQWSVIDVATGTVTPVGGVSPKADVRHFCWSPDGARIAYVWAERLPQGIDPDAATDSRLTVCDADGANPRTILTVTGKGYYTITLGGVDWR